ncbi:hypothetical protein MKS83_08850 [Chryseobacterium sp. Y16C]|uniref:HEAT repeat domain-containing protein n=1 Tax=Chryseobacterium sp. Y16C TaxID=2920939 RepID=UPI001F0C264F|nr:hypothetical protein [Chryseobacterium sp. Y16C]UMQ43799.1 hypothetical protein MKS83_08850 [Chryseobacterium sp. Y16C]
MTTLFLYVSVHELFLTFLGILILVLILIIVVLSYSFYQYKTLNHIHQWSEMIDEKVSEAIVYGPEDQKDNEIFNTYSRESSFRNLFLERLVASEKKFSGGAQDEIKKIFTDYNLQKEAFKKLGQKKPHLIAEGIQELTAMKVESAVPKIMPFLKHPSPQVYQEAQYAMVVFKGFQGLHFLNDFPYIISDWQQLRLLRSINLDPDQCQQVVNVWLDSQNTSVIIFALRLLRKFQMLAFYDKAQALLMHPAIDVRIETVKALQALETSSTIAEFKEIYEEQPLEVQIEILKAMKLSHDPRCANFYKEKLNGTNLPGVKIAAAEALLALGYHDYLLEIIENDASCPQLVQIIKHALQEKI